MLKRIGWGEFYRPEKINSDYNETVRWHAKFHFVETIDEVSSLSDTLLDDIYPSFVMLVQDVLKLAKNGKATFIPNGWSAKDALRTIISWDTIQEQVGSLPPIRELTSDERINGTHPNLDTFVEYVNQNLTNNWDSYLALLARGVQSWALTFNLNEQKWFYKMVIVMFWRKILKKEGAWAVPLPNLMSDIEFDIVPPEGLSNEKYQEAEQAIHSIKNKKLIKFNTSHWRPLVETKRDALKRITDAFNKHLIKEIVERESLCQTAGLEKTPEKRNPEHFRWLVYYLIFGWDYEAITQQYTDMDPEGNRGRGKDAIRKAITSTADLIGIELRK